MRGQRPEVSVQSKGKMKQTRFQLNREKTERGDTPRAVSTTPHRHPTLDTRHSTLDTGPLSPILPPLTSDLCTPTSDLHRKSGQTLIFMALVVVMVAFAALFYFDVHKILHVKGVSRNAGDAAALAGARWQAISLNMVGSLNVAGAMAITDDLSAGRADSPEAELIADLQRRIAFSGPMFGFVASQQAAKNNGLFNQEEFARDLRSHAHLVRNEYHLLYSQPFTPSGTFGTAWEEVAGMLDLMADHGVAVHAPWQYYRNYSHMDHLLLDPAFYDAIAGRSWCWFFYNAFDELQNYNHWTDWDDLPLIVEQQPVNAEIYSLQLRRVRVRDRIPVLPSGDDWQSTLENLRDALENFEARDEAAYGDFDADWAFYNDRWGSWSANIPDNFPWDGEIRSQYDYAGADAAVAVRATTDRHTDFQGADTVNWSAGAKPFGSLEGNARPNTYGLVLPAYTDVRLVPIDATMTGGGGQLRPGWLEFIMVYLPMYIEYGPGVLPNGNWYANQLRAWEIGEFRRAGVDWLLENSDSCHIPPPGGGGGGDGGTYRGH